MKIYVGMSGGVDSSLTAALLKEQGHDVTGVYMKNWTRDIGGTLCPWRDDLADAKRVAVQLGIPFKTYDFQREYKHKVVDYMLAEYKAGRTPNPDIMCNQEIKFALFLRTALDDGADLIATGHYARSKNGQLFKGIDSGKDQSYFLYRVTEQALHQTVMPIGELHKSEVRRQARERGLITANKPDSQGICFVGEVGIGDFIRQFMAVQPGPIVDEQTTAVIGQHGGALLYTIGQRQGLGIGGGLPYYVTRTEVLNNTVYVTTQIDDDRLWKSSVTLSDVHWINAAPNYTRDYRAQVRYHAEEVPCHIQSTQTGVVVRFLQPQRALCPGQSVVIYDQERVLGGGVMQADRAVKG